MPADSPDPARHAVGEVLHGPMHAALDARTVRAVAAVAAIGVSAGRYPKAVPALDANEDAVTGLAGPAGTVVAVADGHLGADAAGAAVEAVARRARRLITGGPVDGRRAVTAVVDEAVDAVAEARRIATGRRRDTATALSVVVVAGGTAWTVTFGDTAVVRVRRGRPRVLSRPGPFLADTAATFKARRQRLRPGDHLVVISDGVADHLGREWPAAVARGVAAGATPDGVVDAVLLGAMDGAAGDHLSCAVVRCDPG